MKGKTIIILLSLILLGIQQLRADADVAQADSAYMQGKYMEALQAYEEIAEQKGVSSQLYYNMGNCAYRINDLGMAVLYYMRALKIDPSNRMARANLEIASQRVSALNRGDLKGKNRSLDPDVPSFLQSIHRWYSQRVHTRIWAAWAAVAFLLTIAGAAMYLFSRRVLVKKIGFFAAISLLGCSVVFLAFAFSSAAYATSQDQAVVTAVTMRLLDSPSVEASPVSSPVHAGTPVQILEDAPEEEPQESQEEASEVVDMPRESEWCKVRVNSQFAGWTKKSDITVI